MLTPETREMLGQIVHRAWLECWIEQGDTTMTQWDDLPDFSKVVCRRIGAAVAEQLSTALALTLTEVLRMKKEGDGHNDPRRS